MYIMMISFTFCMHQNNHTYRQHCHCNTAGVQNMPGVDNIVHYNIPAAFTASNILAAYNSYCKQHSCCIQQLLQHSCSTQQLLQATFLLHTTVAASNIPAACNSYCKQHSCCTQQLLQHSCCTQHSHWQCHGNTTGVHDVTGTVWVYNIVTATFLVLLQHSYTALSWQRSWCTHHWHGNTAGVHTIPMATSLVYTTFLWQHSWCTQHWHGNTAGVHSTVLATFPVYTTQSSQHSHLTQYCHCSKHSCSTTYCTQRIKTHTYTFGKLIEMHCVQCFGSKIAINMYPQ